MATSSNPPPLPHLPQRAPRHPAPRLALASRVGIISHTHIDRNWCLQVLWLRIKWMDGSEIKFICFGRLILRTNLAHVLFTEDPQCSSSSSKSPPTPSPLPTAAPSSAEADRPCLPSLGTPLPSSSPPFAAVSAPSADAPAAGLPNIPPPAPSPSSGESEEEKSKKLLYCSLCKVAVNSLSQLEAHNKGYSNTDVLLKQWRHQVGQLITAGGRNVLFYCSS